MNEVKSPKKPMLYYYAMALLVLLLINFLAVPWLSQRQVKEVDYGTFMTCLLYTSPSPRDGLLSRMPSSA